MANLKEIIVEIHRRSLWQVLGIYVVGSWVGFEVVGQITESVGLPDWVPAFAIVLFIIGLPIVMATAFVQERAPAATESAAQSPAPAPALAKHFTWQKSILGGVTAFLLLGITAGGYMGLRNAGVGSFGSLVGSGALDSRERVLISEFNSVIGDTLLASAVTQAFRISFGQSSIINVLEPAHVRGVLQRMQQDPKARMDADLTREVALRDNIKAFVAGDIMQAGGRYMISAKLISTSDEAVLASYQQPAADSTEILPAVDKLSRKLREKIGESFKSIRADKPLAAVTTSSLEALRKYSQGEHAADVQRDYDAAIPLFEEAVAIDSTFAMAWRKLGVAYNNSAMGREKAVAAASKAYQHRDRLPEVEKYMTTAYYEDNVRGDRRRALAAYNSLLELKPHDRTALSNAGRMHSLLNDREKAAEFYARAIAADSQPTVAYTNLIITNVALDREAEARRVLDAYIRHGGADSVEQVFWLETSRGDYRQAAAIAQRLLAAGRSPMAKASAYYRLSEIAALNGRLRDYNARLREAVAVEKTRGVPAIDLQAAGWEAALAVWVRRDPARAIREANAALERYPLNELPALTRPYLQYAGLFAHAGDAPRARSLLAEYEREIAPDLRGNVAAEIARIRGVIAYSEGRYDAAVSELEAVRQEDTCTLCGRVELALAYERAGQPDHAIAEYEEYLAAPSSRRIWFDGWSLGPVYENLAALYEQKGNHEKAVYYSAKLIELWQNADAELQPRVQAARRTVQRLGARG